MMSPEHLGYTTNIRDDFPEYINKEKKIKELTERSCDNCSHKEDLVYCNICRLNPEHMMNWSPIIPTKYKSVFEITTSKQLDSKELGRALESYLPSKMPCEIREITMVEDEEIQYCENCLNPIKDHVYIYEKNKKPYCRVCYYKLDHFSITKIKKTCENCEWFNKHLYLCSNNSNRCIDYSGWKLKD